MWLADACGEFARFSIGTSVLLSIVGCGVVVLADVTIFIPVAIAAAGLLLIAPMGMCGITLTWWFILGTNHSTRLRAGDFRFAGIFAVLLTWVSAAVGEYALQARPGHALVWATAWPLFVGALMAFSAIQGRTRRRA